jgi:predicted acyltransferase
MNAITVFVLSGLLGRISIEKKVTDAAGKTIALKSYLFETCFNIPLSHLGFSPKICSLSWALTYMLGLYLVAYVMYRRKWFVKF